MLVKVKGRIPIGKVIDGKWINYVPWHEVMAQVKKATDHMVAKKPARQLGGPWISDLVARRRSIALCELCYRRYTPGNRWWKLNNYVPIYSPKDLTDCDGCGEFVLCFDMYPAETPLLKHQKKFPRENKPCVHMAR